MRKLIVIGFLLLSGLTFGQGLPNLLKLAQAQATPPCTPDPNEVATTANAASDPNCNETDGTSGWGTWFGSHTITSEETNVYAGTSKIVITSTTTNSSAVVYGIPGTEVNGDTFTVTFRARTNGGCDATMSLWNNCTGGPSGVDVTTEWVEYTYNITATADNVALKFYPDGGGEGGCGDTGDTIEIDELSIIATN